jgi:hypothetical protein
MNRINDLIEVIQIIAKNGNKTYDDSMPGAEEADEKETIQAALRLEEIIKDIKFK